MSDLEQSTEREASNSGSSSENEAQSSNNTFRSVIRPFFRVERFENGPVNLRWGLADDGTLSQLMSNSANNTSESAENSTDSNGAHNERNDVPNQSNSAQFPQAHSRPVPNALESLLDLYRRRPGGIHDLINVDDLDQFVRNLRSTSHGDNTNESSNRNEPNNNSEANNGDPGNRHNASQDTAESTNLDDPSMIRDNSRENVSSTTNQSNEQHGHPPSHQRVLRSIVYYFAYQDEPFKASLAALDKLKQIPLAEIAEAERNCMICYEPLTEIKPKKVPVGPSNINNDNEDTHKEEHTEETGSGDSHIDVSPDDDDHSPLQMPCGHIFGASCLRAWLNSAVTCPLCRKPIEEQETRSSFRWSDLAHSFTEPLHPDAPWSGIWRHRGNTVLPNGQASTSVIDVNDQRRANVNNWMERLRSLEDLDHRNQTPAMAELRRRQSQLMNDEASRFRESFSTRFGTSNSNQPQPMQNNDTTSTLATPNASHDHASTGNIGTSNLADSADSQSSLRHIVFAGDSREGLNIRSRSLFNHLVHNVSSVSRSPEDTAQNTAENNPRGNPLDIALDRLREQTINSTGQNSGSTRGNLSFAFGPHTLFSVVVGSFEPEPALPGESVSNEPNNSEASGSTSSNTESEDSRERSGPSRRTPDRSHPYNRNSRRPE